MVRQFDIISAFRSFELNRYSIGISFGPVADGRRLRFIGKVKFDLALIDLRAAESLQAWQVTTTTILLTIIAGAS